MVPSNSRTTRSKSKLKIRIGHLSKEINNGPMCHKFNNKAHVIPYEIWGYLNSSRRGDFNMTPRQFLLCVFLLKSSLFTQALTFGYQILFTLFRRHRVLDFFIILNLILGFFWKMIHGVSLHSWWAFKYTFMHQSHSIDTSIWIAAQGVPDQIGCDSTV